ncbi:MAG: valine--pyruvate transaminase, partial [Verrucomicrobiales bacterium]
MSFNFSFSSFGEKIGADCGIVELMQGLGEALAENKEMRMMGGGNPAAIPEVQTIWRKQIESLLTTPEKLDTILGDYDGPSGNPEFIKKLVDLLNKKYNWNLSSKNISITSGA